MAETEKTEGNTEKNTRRHKQTGNNNNKVCQDILSTNNTIKMPRHYTNPWKYALRQYNNGHNRKQSQLQKYLIQ